MNDNMQMTTNGFDGFVKRCNYNVIRSILMGLLIANIAVNAIYYFGSIIMYSHFSGSIFINFIYFVLNTVVPVILLIFVCKKNNSSSFFAPILVYLIISFLYIVQLVIVSGVRMSFILLFGLILLIAYFVGLITMLSTISGNKNSLDKKNYLVPIILITICSIIIFIFAIIIYFNSIHYYQGIAGVFRFFSLLTLVLPFITFIILPLYLQKISEGEGVLTVNYQNASQYNSYANPNGGMQGDGFSNPNNGNSNSNDSFANARNSIDYSFIKMGTGIHVLLFLFTCGIWSLVWIYKVTRYLNCFDNNSYREPINKLLLCMFVPFYSIYWFYVTGKRIDEINRSRNVQTDTGGLLAILAFLVSIAAYIVAQIKIDQLDMEPGYNNYQQNNMPQYNTPQGPQGPQGMNQTYNQNYQQPVNTPNQQYNTPYQQANAQGYGQGNYQPNTQPNPQANTNASTGKSAEQIQELEKLKELLDNGVITQEEFEKMKSDILN